MLRPWRVAVSARAELGESPFWHPGEQCLYYCDIVAHRLYRFCPVKSQLSHWQFNTELASCAPFADGTLLLAMRDGLWRFCPQTQHRTLLSPPPYNPQSQRFNDGKCDPQGRFWVGTLDDQRQPQAGLYCATAIDLLQEGPSLQLALKVENATVSNGLAWSPSQRALYWSDTTAHTIYSFEFDAERGSLINKHVFAQFGQKQNSTPYGGRPDGAAMDEAGNYWVAMFEGQRLLCLSPQGQTLQDIAVPVRCPTMPCFGGSDLKTLYLTTARHGRPESELAAQSMAGCVFAMEVEVAGLPVNFCV